jgi:hypothetical protein
LAIPDVVRILPQGQKHIGGNFFFILRAEAASASVMYDRDDIGTVLPDDLLQCSLAVPGHPFQQLSLIHRASSIPIS